MCTHNILQLFYTHIILLIVISIISKKKQKIEINIYEVKMKSFFSTVLMCFHMKESIKFLITWEGY